MEIKIKTESSQNNIKFRAKDLKLDKIHDTSLSRECRSFAVNLRLFVRG